MNLSILMTSVSTVVGIGAIPFMLKFISGFFLDECSKIEDATLNIIVSLLATLAPCGLGMLIKARFSELWLSSEVYLLNFGKGKMLWKNMQLHTQVGPNCNVRHPDFHDCHELANLQIISCCLLSKIHVGCLCSSAIRRFSGKGLLLLSSRVYYQCVKPSKLGFGCSWAVCEKPRARRTIMLETGLKNAQICLAILKVSFPIQKIGVLQMMPIYFLIFQVK